VPQKAYAEMTRAIVRSAVREAGIRCKMPSVFADGSQEFANEFTPMAGSVVWGREQILMSLGLGRRHL